MLCQLNVVLCLCPSPSVAPAKDPVEYFSGPVVAEDSKGAGPRSGLDILFGTRELDESAWAPIEEQTSFGLQGFFRSGESPLALEFGLLYSTSDEDLFVPGLGNFNFSGEVLDVFFGGRLEFGDGAFRPYVGGGLSLLAVASEGSASGGVVSDDDASVGLYLHGGVAFLLGENLRIGADYRLVTGSEVELFGVSADADYTQLSFFVGFGS